MYQVRATRAYVAGFGTAGSLLAGAALLFVVASAVVSFRGWPQGGSQASPAAVIVSAPGRASGTQANRIAAAASAQVAAAIAVAPAGAATGAGGAAGGGGGLASSPAGAVGHGFGGSTPVQPNVPSGCSGAGCVATPSNGLGGVVSGLGNTVSNAGANVGGTVSGITGSLGSKVGGTSPSLGGAVSGSGKAAGNAVTGATGAAGGALSKVGKLLGSGH